MKAKSHRDSSFSAAWALADGRHVIPNEEGDHAKQAAEWAWNERGAYLSAELECIRGERDAVLARERRLRTALEHIQHRPPENILDIEELRKFASMVVATVDSALAFDGREDTV